MWIVKVFLWITLCLSIANSNRLQYSAAELLRLRFNTLETPVPSVLQGQEFLAPPPRPRYIHRGSGRRRTQTKRQERKRGVDHSVLRPVQRETSNTTTPTVKMELFNAQSINNKASLIHDHIMNSQLDLSCLVETWQRPGHYSGLNEVCPPGYLYLHKARTTSRGGGLAVIYRENLDLSPMPLPTLTSFECLAFKCKPPISTTVLLIYRPPTYNQYFIPEIHDLLTTICANPGNIVILGDLNLHVDSPSSHSVEDFLQILDSLDLTQHVNVPTHSRGHTLDLVITNTAPITNLQVNDLGMSDHKAISMELQITSSISKPKRVIHFRNLKNINMDALTNDLQHLSSLNPESANDAVDLYNSSLSSLLDYHAPLKTRTVTFTRSAPWYTSELRQMKRMGRVLERRYKSTGLTVHKTAYREHQKAYSKSLSDTRSQFYSDIINNSSANSRQLFRTVDTLLNPPTIPLSGTTERCNRFASFFREKVEGIRSQLPGVLPPPLPCPAPSHPPVLTTGHQFRIIQPLCCFTDTTQVEVEGILRKTKPTSCALDPFP